MFKSMKISFLMGGVINVLHQIGLDKEIARKIVHNTPRIFFETMLDPLKPLNGQQKNLIATFAILYCANPPNEEFASMMEDMQQQVMDSFQYQLKINDYRVLGKAMNMVFHLLFQEELMNEEEIKEAFCPTI